MEECDIHFQQILSFMEKPLGPWLNSITMVLYYTTICENDYLFSFTVFFVSIGS